MTSLFFAALVSSALAATPTASTKTVPSEPPAMQPAAQPGAPDTADATNAGAVKVAKVMFIEPKDGATVPTTFTAKFGIEGMKVASAGTMTPGTGHFHVIVDAPTVAKGQTIPSDTTHLHFGKGQTEVSMTLKPGPHTLTLEFADGAHQAYGPMLSQTIKITVK